MSNKTFDRLRFLAEIGLPALAGLVLALGRIWNFSFAEPISATIVALNVFVGAAVGINRSK